MTLASEVVLPIAEGPPVVGEAPAVRVWVDPRPHPPARVRHRRPEDPDDPDEPFVVELWTDEGLVVEFPGSATFAVADDEIVVILDETDDPDLLAHLLLDHVLPRVIDLRGDLMLHASAAVGPDGRAEVFVGPAGTGKSTLAVALGVAGWDLVNDDGIRVTQLLAAGPVVRGARLRRRAAAARRRPPRRPHAGVDRPHVEGLRQAPLPGRRHAAAHGRGPGSDRGGQRAGAGGGRRSPRVETLGLAEAVTVIAEHAFHLAPDPELITRQAFEKASALAGSVPVRRLVIPDDLEQLGQVATFLAVARTCPDAVIAPRRGRLGGELTGS